ncbi:MAG: 4Fe-4S dicluster domain-containing protein [Desulfobulbaceae bacterium]|nr:4Fe-4S dicluster domain-containing protein [Desulfobulbaceae bacterium]
MSIDQPVENRCATCTLCQESCPAGAIKGVKTKDHYQTREEALYFDRCVQKLTGEFAQIPNVGAPICGICIKACPFSRKFSALLLKGCHKKQENPTCCQELISGCSGLAHSGIGRRTNHMM